MRDLAHSDYRLIEKSADLYGIAGEFQNEPAIAVDLEGDSLFHYHERVCLLQISTPTQNIVIDPLSVEDLSPLAPVFADNRIRKVFHGADYDIRCLYRDFGIEVHSLFDTQIAARFLGVSETGLASLLREKFDVLKDKKYQKKDWSQRPLPAAMLQYAVQDICHLLSLADILERGLIKKGLLFCVEEECELLSRVRPNLAEKRPFFLSFKGAAGLDRRSLAVLEKILSLRDQVAKRRDCPHFKVLGEKQVMDIVRIKPVTKAGLNGIKGLTPKMIDVMGNSLINKVEEGLGLPEEVLPVYPKKSGKRLRSKEMARVRALKSWRDRRARGWKIDPAIVCTNAQIKEIAIANPRVPDKMEGIKEIRKWQIRLFGRDICNILQKAG